MNFVMTIPFLSRRYLSSIGILIVGLGLSVTAFYVARSWENRRVQDELSQQLDKLQLALTYSIEDKQEVAETLAAFFGASEQVERREFQTFTQPLLKLHQGIYSLGWVARVPGHQRTQYEQTIAAQGFPDFKIYHREQVGRLTQSRAQPEYFPITYAEPANHQPSIGYDLLSEPIQRAALLQAKQTGVIAVTEPVNLVDREQVAIAFLPIFARSSNSNSKEIAGFIRVVFSLKSTVATGLSSSGLWDLNFSVYDEYASPDRHFIIRYESSSSNFLRSEFPSEMQSSSVGKILCPQPITCVRQLKIGNRQWTMEFHPTPLFIQRYRYWTANFFLTIGLLLTVGFAAYVLISQRYMTRIEKLAHEHATQAAKLNQALSELKQAQTQLIQTEKMSSLGQLVAGVAHEINNPVSFIYGNLQYAKSYTHDLLNLVKLYQQHYPTPTSDIQMKAANMDLNFLMQDMPRLLDSMHVGADRIKQIVLSLRIFSRMDEAEMKVVNLHEGIDSTLMLLQNRLKAKGDYPNIEVIKHYGNLPPVECYAGQINQVFMNILANAIDALEDCSAVKSQDASWTPTIAIYTAFQQGSLSTLSNGNSYVVTPMVQIRIVDNGSGIPEPIQQRLFDPFFTTKPIGKGTGMGLSISYQIITQKHYGTLECISIPGEGAEFVIQIPVKNVEHQNSALRYTNRTLIS